PRPNGRFSTLRHNFAVSAFHSSAGGVEPRCFDAPLDTPDGITRWQAVTFLMQTPDGLMSRNVEPLLGVTWGHFIADGVPTINDSAHAGQSEGDGLKPILTRDCPEWTFVETLSVS